MVSSLNYCCFYCLHLCWCSYCSVLLLFSHYYSLVVVHRFMMFVVDSVGYLIVVSGLACLLGEDFSSIGLTREFLHVQFVIVVVCCDIDLRYLLL